MPQNKDNIAFEQTLEAYKKLIASLASSFPERYREDLRQEGNIGLYAAYSTFSAASGVPFGAYATLCIKRRMITAYRALCKDDKNVSFDESDVTVSGPSPEQSILDSNYVSSVIDSVRHTLTDLENRVLTEYLSRGGSTALTAKNLGLSPKTVDNAMTRVKKKLRERFSK